MQQRQPKTTQNINQQQATETTKTTQGIKTLIKRSLVKMSSSLRNLRIKQSTIN